MSHNEPFVLLFVHVNARLCWLAPHNTSHNTACRSQSSLSHGCVGWLLTTPLTTPLTTLRADRNHHSPTVVLAGCSHHSVPTAITSFLALQDGAPPGRGATKWVKAKARGADTHAGGAARHARVRVRCHARALVRTQKTCVRSLAQISTKLIRHRSTLTTHCAHLPNLRTFPTCSPPLSSLAAQVAVVVALVVQVVPMVRVRVLDEDQLPKGMQPLSSHDDPALSSSHCLLSLKR